MNAVRSRRRPVRTATERHRQWLQLVETDGPFLSIPVLKRVYPQGMAPLDGRVLGELKEAKTPFEQACLHRRRAAGKRRGGMRFRYQHESDCRGTDPAQRGING